MLYEKSFYYLLLLALPMAAGLTLTADRIILFLYGPQFSAAAAALIMLAWAEALLFLHLIMGFLLTAIDRQGLFTAATAAYAAANVAINLVLIPRYGAAGAAAAALSGGLIFGLGGLDWAALLLTFFISSSLGWRSVRDFCASIDLRVKG